MCPDKIGTVKPENDRTPIESGLFSSFVVPLASGMRHSHENRCVGD
ncbi:MAG: hypothetical protein HYX80_07750 [Chloroflexi bacterium]|nr:hypothetical protein [Chloroflexota bacterium]